MALEYVLVPWRLRQSLLCALVLASLVVACGDTDHPSALRLESITPAEGGLAGGTRLTLTGAGFTPDVGVLFAKFAAEDVRFVNPRVIEVLTPPGQAGPVDVQVLAPDRAPATLDHGFTYLEPEAEDFAPKRGPAAGGTQVHVYGSAFGRGAAVFFGDQAATETTFIDEGHLTAIAPAAEPGSVALTVRSGDESCPLTAEFEYLAGGTNATSTPRVVSATARDNGSVLVTFDRAMGGRAEEAASYQISTVTSSGAPTVLAVLGAEFVEEAEESEARSRVQLTTGSQSAVAYTLRVNGVVDREGRAFAAPVISVAGGIVDPAEARFVGIPPSGEGPDSDGDGLKDTTEQLGWVVRVVELDGAESTHTVTSDPFLSDTDEDGVNDLIEKQWLTDPRSADTDADDLTDFQELNELLSNPTHQDTDGDTLPDGYEFNFFQTSPLLADTDGDQLRDDYELLFANRNARVADLPAPTIEIGETRLELDVRFREESALEIRELETSNVTATLKQSDKQEYSNMNSSTAETFAKLAIGSEFEVSASPTDLGGKFTTRVNVETGWTGTWTSQHTTTSTHEAEQAYEESLTTEAETRANSTVVREVLAARMQVTVFVKNASNLAYHVKNLQLTAFIQDPLDPTALTPVATLLPDAELEGGYTLGPLVPERGPFVFSNDVIFPSLVESLMKNPRGLVFIISNFDIDDELGRNFAFSSQEVVERTASLVIDNGSFDSDGDGEGDLTEHYRIATGSGRQLDTNGSGALDGEDRRVVFDGSGRQVGITLKDALDAIGLAYYDEVEDPTESLSEAAVQGSYSTVIDDAGVERLYRIRDRAIEEGVPRSWEVMTPTGIDQTTSMGDFILRPDSDVKLVFAQDLDGDRMPANVEFLNHCSDVLEDTDGDGIDDRTEVLIGREVHTALGTRRIFTSCSLADSDGDGLSDAEEASGAADCDGDGKVDVTSPPSDAATADTDGDTIPDRDEVCGFEITLRASGEVITTRTDPTNPDSDGDTADDGTEQRLGGDPNDAGDRDDFADDDADGLVNVQELDGWQITTFGVSTTPELCNTRCDDGPERLVAVSSDPAVADSDGDGLLDGEEYLLNTNPTLRDTDADGIDDLVEVAGFELRDLGIIVTDPVDADTDDDKLSDGIEAEVEGLEQDRWIVRVEGAEPYQVSSNPLLADEDFDTLVDGDERRASWTGTDPTYYNTDDDRRDDWLEVSLGLDPLSPRDFLVQQVTVSVDRFVCTESDDGTGDSTLEINLFSVVTNGSNCADLNDNQCVSLYPAAQQAYYTTDGGSWSGGTDRAAAVVAQTLVLLEYDLDNYDFAAARLVLSGEARDHDALSGDDTGSGAATIRGRDFFENGGVHILPIRGGGVGFDAYVTVHQGPRVPCSQAVTAAGQCR